MSYHIAKGDYDDERLIRYLIGSLDEPEAERFDELSIADDRFADRLRAVEDDLVDAYARGELSGVRLQQFRSAYLSVPARREKVRFAETLLARLPVQNVAALPAARRQRTLPAWAVAAAAVLVAAGGYVLMDQTRSAPAQPAGAQAAPGNPQAVPGPLARHDTRLPPRTPPTDSPAAEAPPAALTAPTLAFTLMPPTRSAGGPPVVTMSRSATRADLHLVLESDDFRDYQVALKDSAADRVMWRSERLNATTLSGSRVVTIRLDVAALQPQRYVLELTGFLATGVEELVTSYPFQLVLQ